MRAIRLITLICLFVGFGVNNSFAQQGAKVLDKKFFAVSAALAISSIYDVESTKLSINSGLGRESNPIMAPFINSGRPAAYVYLAGLNSGSLYFAYRLKKHKDPHIRRLWWIVPVCEIVSHVFAGSSNLRLARQPR